MSQQQINSTSDELEFETPGSAFVTAHQEVNGNPTDDILDQIGDEKSTEDTQAASTPQIDEEETTETSKASTEDDASQKNINPQPETSNEPITTAGPDTDALYNGDDVQNLGPVDETHLFSGYQQQLENGQNGGDDNNQQIDLEQQQQQQDPAQLDFDSIEPDLPRAIDAKQRGNKSFATGNYEEALEFYSEALLFCPDQNVVERALFHNNKCAAHIMLKEWDDAIFEADCVLELEPHNIKALTRRAKAYESDEKYQEAIDTYKILVDLEPKVKLYQNKIAELTKLQEAKFEKQKEEMLTQLKGWGNSVLGWFGMSTDNFQMVQDPATGSYSVNFVQNPQKPPE